MIVKLVNAEGDETEIPVDEPRAHAHTFEIPGFGRFAVVDEEYSSIVMGQAQDAVLDAEPIVLRHDQPTFEITLVPKPRFQDRLRVVIER